MNESSVDRPNRPAQVLRLPGPAFERVFQKGRRIGQSSLVLIAMPSFVGGPGAPPPAAVRLGVMVGRKIVRNAAPRNRLRRILRESFKMHAEVHVDQPMDCILLARDSARSFKVRQDADPVVQRLIRRCCAGQ